MKDQNSEIYKRIIILTAQMLTQGKITIREARDLIHAAKVFKGER